MHPPECINEAELSFLGYGIDLFITTVLWHDRGVFSSFREWHYWQNAPDTQHVLTLHKPSTGKSEVHGDISLDIKLANFNGRKLCCKPSSTKYNVYDLFLQIFWATGWFWWFADFDKVKLFELHTKDIAKKLMKWGNIIRDLLLAIIVV